MSKILVADDDPSILQFCTFVLEKLKHTVVTAETGPETLSKLKSDKPDLLLLDVMLPGMDGYTLQIQMSEDENLFHVPIIVISALEPSLSLFEKSPQVCCRLMKPFKMDVLEDAVHKALNDERIKELRYRPYL